MKQATDRYAFSHNATASAHRSVIAICSNMAEPVFAFQLPEMDVLLKIRYNHQDMNHPAEDANFINSQSVSQQQT